MTTTRRKDRNQPGNGGLYTEPTRSKGAEIDVDAAPKAASIIVSYTDQPDLGARPPDDTDMPEPSGSYLPMIDGWRPNATQTHVPITLPASLAGMPPTRLADVIFDADNNPVYDTGAGGTVDPASMMLHRALEGHRSLSVGDTITFLDPDGRHIETLDCDHVGWVAVTHNYLPPQPARLDDLDDLNRLSQVARNLTSDPADTAAHLSREDNQAHFAEHPEMAADTPVQRAQRHLICDLFELSAPQRRQWAGHTGQPLGRVGAGFLEALGRHDLVEQIMAQPVTLESPSVDDRLFNQAFNLAWWGQPQPVDAL